MKINCIAIDDEPLALDKIREYIKRVGYLNLLSTFDNAIDALEFIKENKVDLIFLDIQMEELTGIQMLETLQLKPKVVLTTAYDETILISNVSDAGQSLTGDVTVPVDVTSATREVLARGSWVSGNYINYVIYDHDSVRPVGGGSWIGKYFNFYRSIYTPKLYIDTIEQQTFAIAM